MDLFDWQAGQQGKREGMARAEEHADEDWRYGALIAAHEAAVALPYLTADDVVQRIPEDLTTHEMRALGPVMRRAMKAGWIVKSDRPAVFCARRSRHRAPLQVWHSLIFEGWA